MGVLGGWVFSYERGTPVVDDVNRWVLRGPLGCVRVAQHPSHIMHLWIGFRKSTPPQNRHLIVYNYLSKYEVDGFVGELTF
jgi:hypothetical protein